MPSVRHRMEGYRWRQYCQLADKGWPCLISPTTPWDFKLMKIFIVLPSAEALPDLTTRQRNSTSCAGVYMYARSCVPSLQRLVCHVLFAGTCAVMHVSTVQEPCHISVELTINTLVTFSAHTSSVSLTICCHMLHPCMLFCLVFFAKLKGCVKL